MPQDSTQWRPIILKTAGFIVFLQVIRSGEGDLRGSPFQGKFFSKWEESFHGLNRWNDGDTFDTNYIEHPVEGAVFFFIYMRHNPRLLRSRVGFNREFLVATSLGSLYSALASFMFEVGPISEATIGPSRKGKQGLIDFVVTPVIGSWLWATGERLMYEKVIAKMIKSRHIFVKVAGCFLTITTPARGCTNLLGGSLPWKAWN